MDGVSSLLPQQSIDGYFWVGRYPTRGPYMPVALPGGSLIAESVTNTALGLCCQLTDHSVAGAVSTDRAEASPSFGFHDGPRSYGFPLCWPQSQTAPSPLDNTTLLPTPPGSHSSGAPLNWALVWARQFSEL